jgi:hypothetical protein
MMTIALLQKPKSDIPKTADETLLHPKSGITKVAVGSLLAGLRELVVFCPKCKALETLSFDSGSLVETRKFIQNDGHIYHDCGSDRPCRVYRVN